MKIKYNIVLKNPIKKSLQALDLYDKQGDFSVKVSEQGFLIEGFLKDTTQTVIKAYNHSFLGDGYSLTSSDNLSLKKEDQEYVNIEDVLAVLNKTVLGNEFKKIQDKIIKVLSSDSSYKLQEFVEKSSDVFLLKISMNGLITALKATVKNNSNTIVLSNTEVVLASDVLIYVKTSKTLRIDTDNYLFISKEDALKLPAGFCTLDNKVLIKTLTEYEIKDNYSFFTSLKQGKITFSSEVLVDGLKVKSYEIKENEKIVLQPSQEYSSLSLDNIENNITIIYEVLEDKTIAPYLVIDAMQSDASSTTELQSVLLTKLNALLQADKEFLKKYIRLEYKTLINTQSSQHTILNQSVLDALLNTTTYLGYTLKYEP